MLQVSLLDRSADLVGLEAEWRALMGQSPELVATPTWVLSWWRVMGGQGGRRIQALAVRDEGGVLVGLWPLLRRVAVEKKVFPFRRLEMLGSGEEQADEVCSDYLGPITAEDRRPEIVQALADAVVEGRAGTWDDLVVPTMRADAPATTLLADALRARGAQVTLTPEGGSPFIALPATWDAYLASLEGERRYFVKRSIRDFEAWAGPGGMVLERLSREAELDEGVRVLAALHEDRWEGGGVFASARFTAFHRHVMRDLLRGRDGRLDLLFLRVRGEPLAALYNLVVGDKTYFYQSGRRTDLPPKIRVGIVVHALAIQRAIAEGQREYDFMKGDSQYKQKLATGRHPLVTLRAVRGAASSRALDATLEAATRLARDLRARRLAARNSTTTDPPG